MSRVGLALACAVLGVAVAWAAAPLARMIRDWRMQRVMSAHYEILYPAASVSREALAQFAAERETLFETLNHRLGDTASSVRLRLILDPRFSPGPASDGLPRSYSVDGTTVRARLSDSLPKLDPAADAEALLYAVWGQPGIPRVGYWTAQALVGQWQGQDLGMMAAGVEQRLGHQEVANLLRRDPQTISSPRDHALLGAAWIAAIVDFAGAAQVRKLYSAKIPDLDMGNVARVLGTNSAELERTWQLWMDSYLAGMPRASHSMTMPMGMPMPSGR